MEQKAKSALNKRIEEKMGKIKFLINLNKIGEK